jgi:hypothetical protein
MDAATDEELRRLRARAYGPTADIDQDPAAVRRLQELEALRRRRSAAGPEVEATPDHDPEGGDQPLADLGLLSSPVPDSEEESPAPADRLPRRRTGRWILAVLASAALAAGVTAAVIWVIPVRVSAGAPQVATLEPSLALEVPPQWFGAAPDAAVYEFYGLTLFESEYSPNSGILGGENSCFSVVNSDQVPATEDFDASSWSLDGQIYSDCSMGAFPATVEVPIDGDSPDSLRARYPEGTAVQFVLDGDRIGVFLDNT